MNSSNVYQNIDTGVLMSANDYNCLSDDQKERMIKYDKSNFDFTGTYIKYKCTAVSISNMNARTNVE